jgi:hypothetical protein
MFYQRGLLKLNLSFRYLQNDASSNAECVSPLRSEEEKVRQGIAQVLEVFSVGYLSISTRVQ